MSTTSTPVLAFRYAIMDVLGGIVLFPFWWYSVGAVTVMSWAGSSIRETSRLFGLGVWVRNLFVPMYGDTSFVGRAISFGIRLIMIVVRGLAVACWSLIILLCVLLYLLVLPAAVSGLVFHLVGLFLV